MNKEALTYRCYEGTAKYVQQRNILQHAGELLRDLGHRISIIADSVVAGIVGDVLSKSLQRTGLDVVWVPFGGECSKEEVARLCERCGESDVVVGVGGGKTLDAAKVVGERCALPMVSMPTLASNDSPVSRVAVLYTSEGSVDRVCIMRQHPALVIVDPAVIARAPLRFTIAGMGDALATWFEARACAAAHGRTILGGVPTEAGLSIARRCYELVMTHGRRAINAIRSENWNDENIDAIVEANILLSGLGFENGGLAFAHAFCNGLTQVPESHQALHGEIVAFGTIIQCVLENAAETEAVVRFCSDVGLPTALSDLSCTKEQQLRTVILYMLEKERAKLRNMPEPMTAGVLLDAIREADRLGRTGRLFKNCTT